MITIVTMDFTTLPAALLLQAKDHCRVWHNDDDAFITSAIGRAIHHFEIKTETKVFPAEYKWTPPYGLVNGRSAWVDGRTLSPISPVKDFKAFVGTDEVTANYSFATESSIYGTGTYFLVGSPQSGLQIQQMKTGYSDVALIPPGILDRVLHLTATYYENRELLVGSGQFLNPLAQNQDLAGWWVPKA